VQQPLVHNGRIVLESDGRKAFINKRDNHVLIELAQRYLPERQTAKKVDITTHTDNSGIIPDIYDLRIDGRFLTIEEVRTIKDIMQAVENRKASTIVIESERVEQVGEV
jgi:hypothetical protein